MTILSSKEQAEIHYSTIGQLIEMGNKSSPDRQRRILEELRTTNRTTACKYFEEVVKDANQPRTPYLS